MAVVDEASRDDLPAFQITLTSSKQPITIRQLLSSQVSRVVMIPGIVIASSKVKAKATTVVAQCKGCHANKQVGALSQAAIAGHLAPEGAALDLLRAPSPSTPPPRARRLATDAPALTAPVSRVPDPGAGWLCGRQPAAQMR